MLDLFSAQLVIQGNRNRGADTKTTQKCSGWTWSVQFTRSLWSSFGKWWPWNLLWEFEGNSPSSLLPCLTLWQCKTSIRIFIFSKYCYYNLQNLLSLDDDQEDSDALCKFHELCCLQFALMLQCVFSYSKFCYCQLSRMVNNPQVTVLCPNMTQKFCCNLRLMKPKMELQACMSSCPYFFSTIPCYELMGWCLHLFLYLNFSTG